MGSRLKVDITSDARGVKRGADEAESRLSKFANGVGKYGKLAGLGIAAVGVAAVGMAGAVVKSASEAQQASGAVASVYGKHAREVESNAKRAANAVGLSATEYRNMASIVGSQLKNMGRSQAQSAKQSNELIKMGADLAATYGGSVSDAIGAVSSLLRGETDPIERYGVSIKQSDINARLAAQGLDHLTGAAAKQAQATAVLGLLTSQTAAAHGAFGRESNTLAGQQERLRAKFENVKATVGAGLLPVLTAGATLLNDKLFPAVGRASAVFSEKFGPSLRQIGAVIRDRIIPAGRDLFEWYATKIAPAFAKILGPALAGVRSWFEKIRGSVENNRDRFEQLGKVLKGFAEFVAKYVAPVVGKTLGLAFSTLGTLVSTALNLFGSLLDAIEAVVDAIGKVGSAAGKVGGVVGKLNPFGGVEVWGGTGELVGRALSPSAPNVGGLATAALTYGAYDVSPGGSGLRGGVPVVVDRRSTSIRVDGALDAVSVAEQIRRLLGSDDVRMGRVGAWGAR